MPEKINSLEEELLKLPIGQEAFDIIINRCEKAEKTSTIYEFLNFISPKIDITFSGNHEGHMYGIHIFGDHDEVLMALYNARYERAVMDWCSIVSENKDGLLNPHPEDASAYYIVVDDLINDLGKILSNTNYKITKRKEILRKHASQIAEKADFLIAVAAPKKSEEAKAYLSLLDNAA
jgi:hypothetical protein